MKQTKKKTIVRNKSEDALYFAIVQQEPNNNDWSWVIKGLGELVRIHSIVCEDGDKNIYRVIHTGPSGADAVIAGRGFVFNGDMENPIPWSIQ